MSLFDKVTSMLDGAEGEQGGLVSNVMKMLTDQQGGGLTSLLQSFKKRRFHMRKRNSLLTSRVWFSFICAAVMLTLVLGITTISYAQKKAAEVKGAVVDINTADQKTLESLPGVGKATAAAIIAGRPYKSVDDLKRVKGMSDAKVQALKDKVTVGGGATSTAPPAASQRASSTQKAATATEKGSKTTSKLAPGQRVNINTATKQEIEALPGIGPAKAQMIIDGRPYNKPEDIMKVKGIKQKVFDKIKDNITVR